MANSILHSVRGKRNGGTLHDIETGIEEQIEHLRAEIASLTKLVGKSSAGSGEKLRHQAEAGFEDLVARSEELLRDIHSGYVRGAREVRATVRSHPAATVAAAAALGLVIALLARR
ncbi:DUF883 family protein [Rhizobium sp. BK251]|uniref:DUF883 family protein n=1 Tax=Rhizobium sp. BK251 TaxID=2512125 RepID=UPI00104DF3FA|nr:DUF883 family protein [Rhizobium sp. BK251]TCL74523.1 ElaB/YqjD/DUF883 family membrane-anchored ribosome-binding protein [Rhizobium sp. BK251]